MNKKIIHNMSLLMAGLLATLLLKAQQPPQAFSIAGQVVDEQNGILFLNYVNAEETSVRDTAKLERGAFHFSGNISGPTVAYLSWSADKRRHETSVFLEAAPMRVTFKMNQFKEAKVSGSKTQAEYEKYQAQINRVKQRWKVVMDTLSAINKRSNIEYQETKNWVLQPYNTEMQELQSKFIREHPSSYVTPYILRTFGRTLVLDTLEKIYNGLPVVMKNSTSGKEIARYIKTRHSALPGTTAPAFAATDINGARLNLDDFRGKYVLLDFWASWCVPCRKGNPHLRALYSKYNESGFEIVGIADDDRVEKLWRTAVEKDEIGVWRHVLRGLKKKDGVFDHTNDISYRYGVEILPTKILIDKKGVVIGRYSVEEDELDKQLKEVFGF